MKRDMFRKYTIALLPFLLLACEKEMSMDNTMVGAPDVRASFQAETKTVLSTDSEGNGTISWLPNEKINVFFNTAGIAYTSSNTEPATKTTFTTDAQVSLADLESGIVWGLYPFDASAKSDGSHIMTRFSGKQSGVPGTFDTDFYPLLAHSTSTDLSFYNVCGGIKFSLSRDDIYKIVLRSNANEALAGQISLSIKEGYPQAEVLSGEQEITLTPKNGAVFQKDQYYYIVCLPGKLSQGFQMDFYSEKGEKATYKKDEAFAVKRAVFAKKDHIDESVDEWIDNPEMTGGKRSGLYLGITGFNQELYTYPITRLNEVTIYDFDSFVNDLQMKNGSLLCYGVDFSIDRLKEAVFPDDLCAVALVTFTDGLDQGSVMMNPTYGNEDNYLEAIQDRIQNENISRHNITAYSVGLKGSDVSDVVKFRDNLRKLASNSDYAFEVKSMSEVNSRLQAIAKNVTAISYIYDLSITIPGQSDGTRIRITFDYASDADESTSYIEGTFRLGDYSLHDVTYHGLSSTSGNTIQGAVNGIFVTFSFDSVRVDNGKTLSPSSISQWAYVSSTGKWQVNSEFDANQNMDIEVTKQSVAVMLVIDCSSSLDYQYYTMQDNVLSFISALQEASYDPYAVSSVRLDYTSKTVYVGDSFQLKAIVGPDSARDKSVLWTTSNPNIAHVDQDGIVTTTGIGEVVITATTMDGGYSANCKVTVKPVPVSGVSLDKSSVTLFEGESLMLLAKVYPDNASNSSVNWKSTNTAVATVDEEGNVTAVSKGTATIRAEAKDGSGKYATCSVTVKRPVSSIVLNKSSLVLSRGASAVTETLTATVSPSDANNKSVTWTSSNTSVATVSSSGVVTGKARGTATITVEASDGKGAKATCEVEVKQLVTGITLEKSSVTLVEGEGIMLTAVVNPENANDPSLKWSSSNPAAATVDDDGNVTAVSLGTATIKAEAQDGSGKYATCSVSVSRPVTSIVLDKTSLVLSRGASIVTETLTATVTPSDASNKTLTWTSSNTSVATVSSAGMVTGRARGTATITVEASDGRGAKATCEVEVIQLVTGITIDKTSLLLGIGDETMLSVTSVLPDNANDKDVVWSSSNSSVATVDNSGRVIAMGGGTATINATANDGGGAYASCSVKVKNPCPSGAVDLGLSVYWATCNIGANTPEEFGNHYAWGETETKPSFTLDSYKFRISGTTMTNMKLSKYNSSKTYGTVDNKVVLEAVDDAASVLLGKEWRMPTKAEFEELLSNCTQEWTTYNGVDGCKFTSKKAGYTDRWVFFPAAGYYNMGEHRGAASYGHYWSSSLYTEIPTRAWELMFHQGEVLIQGYDHLRYFGRSIRPVYEE